MDDVASNAWDKGSSGSWFGACLPAMANDLRAFRQEVRRLVLKSERRLITAEWAPILGVKIDDSSGNQADAATIGMPAMFDPKRERKFAEVVSVKRADPHQVALLNRTEVFQAMASQSCFSPLLPSEGFPPVS